MSLYLLVSADARTLNYGIGIGYENQDRCIFKLIDNCEGSEFVDWKKTLCNASSPSIGEIQFMLKAKISAQCLNRMQQVQMKY